MKKITMLALILLPTLAAASWFNWYEGDKKAEKSPAVVQTKTAQSGAATPVKTTLTGGSSNPYEARTDDIVYGSADAPVTILEYASMTCNHCAKFHQKVLSKLKATVVKDGTAKVVFRELPWDNTALAVSQVVRCAAPESRAHLLSALFDGQEKWMRAENPLNEIKAIAAMAGGLDGQKVEKCIRDPQIRAHILATKQEAQQKLGVNATPFVFVNGKKVENAFKVDELVKMVRAEAAKVVK